MEGLGTISKNNKNKLGLKFAKFADCKKKKYPKLN